MTDTNKQTGRIQELTALLGEAAKAYYMENREVMPNITYDKLYDELAALESETGIRLAGSPTQRIGYSISPELARETHPSPMLSLDKTKDPAELSAWLKDKRGLLSWKLDGLTIALTYENGSLTKAVTRGDGLAGEVVTHNAMTFANLPLSIPFKGRLNLRGEAVISYTDFEKINREIEDIDAKYKNPRNLASGSVRQLNSEITAARCVCFYAFALVGAEDMDFRNSREAQLQFLSSQGFDVVEYIQVTAANTEESVSQFASRLQDGKMDLPSDGLVLIYDDIAYGESLGRTAKFPKDGIAFKWEDEQMQTVLTDIEWNASRTGLINPIAIFAPVEIEGTTVSRASLHNVSIMQELALGLGDEILVYKANMIIPQISENLTRSATCAPPEACPVCGTSTQIKNNDGVQSLFCVNPVCPAKRLGEFAHLVSQSALNIEGLSEQSLEKFISAGFIHEPADIFHLSELQGEITTMEGFGVKSFDNLIAAVEKARVSTPTRLLYSLGISQIGLSNAKLICRAFDNDWDKICNATEDELTEIEGIGSVIARGYTEWFANEANASRAAALRSELHFDTANMKAQGDALKGLTFVITGSLEHYANRDELKTAIEDLGGRTSGSVSEKTSYLINNDAASGSSKNKKAKQLGVSIITEAEFIAMITGEN